ncbi:MAG: putative Se/S carrier-like protein [Eubacteriales bacterium]
MPDCIIAMQTRTAAERARRTAMMGKIHADVVSVDPSVTRHGCSVGLRLNCADVEEVTGLLDRKNIVYGDIIGRGR